MLGLSIGLYHIASQACQVDRYCFELNPRFDFSTIFVRPLWFGVLTNIEDESEGNGNVEKRFNANIKRKKLFAIFGKSVSQIETYFSFEAVLKYFCRSTRFLSDVTNKANYVSENLAQQGAGPCLISEV